MKRLLPDRVEIAIFVALAVVCAAVVSTMSERDLGLSAMSVPIFIASALMGMRRSGQLRRVPQVARRQTQTQE